MLLESDPVGSCFFVIVVVPWLLTVPGGAAGHPSLFSPIWNNQSFLQPYLKEDAGLFGRKFAYMILDRFGDADTYGGSFRIYWQGLWALARWAAEVNGFEIDPFSVVVRSRPDMSFENPFDFRKLMKLFRNDTVAGQHLQVGQMYDSDLSLITSFSSYETDIAALVEHGLRTGNYSYISYGMENGWCRGRVLADPPRCMTIVDYAVGPMPSSSRRASRHRFESCKPYFIFAWDNHAICRLAAGGYTCGIQAKNGAFLHPKVDLFWGRCAFPLPHIMPTVAEHLKSGLTSGDLVEHKVVYINNGGWQECKQTLSFTEVLRRYPFR